MIASQRSTWNRQVDLEMYGLGSMTMLADESSGTLQVGDFLEATPAQTSGVLFTTIADPDTLLVITGPDQVFFGESLYGFVQMPSASGSMSILPMDEISRSETMAETEGEPIVSASEEEVLDWDFALMAPPIRPSGVVHVRLRYVGRSKPRPDDDSWSD